ncbi:hypothetical protein DRW48_13800 [Paracoccus suum]|uniref:Uncharacterized protein n=1 Tax=Paracoccus suum TaxID=2259340 RepID=A0A344PML2_9RHOB|nr:hypothetical protein [Paracoccus suum]AXC50617.1 hypothetical protein DRW48_13800 [Paracoccus suum]
MRVLKVIVALAILAVAGLAGFAYFGEMDPEPRETRIPVTLKLQPPEEAPIAPVPAVPAPASVQPDTPAAAGADALD